MNSDIPPALRLAASKRSTDAQARVLAALDRFVRESLPITESAVAREAGVSGRTIRNHPSLRSALLLAKERASAGEQSAGRRRNPATISSLRAQLANKDERIRAMTTELKHLRAVVRRQLGSNVDDQEQRDLRENIERLEQSQTRLSDEVTQARLTLSDRDATIADLEASNAGLKDRIRQMMNFHGASNF